MRLVRRAQSRRRARFGSAVPSVGIVKGDPMPLRRVAAAPLRATRLSRRTLGAVAGAARAASTLPARGPRAGSTAAQDATPVASPAGGAPAELAAATDRFVRDALETYGVPGAAV